MKRREWLHQHLPEWAWDNLATALFLVACGVIAAAFYLIVSNNNNRINDIQRSRVESCQRTYEGIREVFRPFFPPPPRSARQQADLDKFNRTIDKLKSGCG